MTLQEQLMALAAEHNLSAISVGISHLPDGTPFATAIAHAEVDGATFCSLASGVKTDASLAQKLAVAIGEATAWRAAQLASPADLVEPLATL